MESSRSAPNMKGRPETVIKNNDANMEDVPLPSINQHQSMPELNNSSNTTKSRTASLKRFFKINKKSEKELDQLPQIVVNELKKGGGGSSSHGKRFGLGLLSSSHLTTENSDRDAEPTTSRVSLKSSLSSYWNTLFKKNKKHSAINLRENESSTPVAELESNNVDSNSENQDNDSERDLEMEDKAVEANADKFSQLSETEDNKNESLEADREDNDDIVIGSLDNKNGSIDNTENQNAKTLGNSFGNAKDLSDIMTGSFKVQLINMGTRAAAFQAKLRCLHEYHVRLLHNVLPAPSGVDIANTIKYFSQTLLTVLKDVRTSPHDLIRDPLEDPTRMSAYPNLEYGNLYNALTMLIDVAPCIQYGQIVFGKALLQCLCCILPFLDKDLIDNLPYLASSTISVLPPGIHQDIVNALCYYILPFTITRRSSIDDQECQACQSVSSVILMVLQYSTNPAHHCQLLECLMTLKHNVVKDILCVIAYGTSLSRTHAAKLLFYYWPAFDPNLFDRKVLLSKLTNDMVPFVCQREHCPNSGNAEAAKVCYDHSISITYAPDCPPPLYLCIECANEIHREHANLEFGDILHPMQQVSMVCENKNCRSSEKSAFSICFSTECASYNGNHPIRYCSQCHSNRHNSRRGGDHIVHRSLPPAWQMDPEMQMNMVESIISLLKEAKPLHFEPGRESSIDSKKNGGHLTPDTITLEQRQMLGRYGIWLLVGRCTPTPDTPVEVLGRILSMLFHWFHITAYSYDAGQIESTIEKLKVEHVCDWLKEICKIHYNVFISCLLPHPPEHARVGGHWESLASRTSHLKEGLQRLICLVPYEVITSEIWDYVMPHWMEAITNDVAEKELNDLKIVLSKILDPDMSPLGFDAKTMYNFVAIRFEKTTAKVQQQALHWLQILTKLGILIPLVQLFAMFGDGVRIMKYGIQHEIMREKENQPNKGPKTPCKEIKSDLANPPRRSSISPVVEDDSCNTSAISDDEAPTNRHTEFSTDAEHNLTCCILMLDILLKQMELQDIEQHMGIHTSVCENVSRLLKCMVTAARVGLSSHVCSLKVAECAYCEASIMWHQLSTKLVQFMAPLNPIRPPDPPIEDIIEEEKSSRKSPPESDKDKTRERDVSLSMAPLPIPLGPLGGFAGPMPVAVPQPEPHSVGGVLVHMPHVCSNNENGHSNDNNELRKVHATDEIMTATVETVSEQLDLASILPTDRAIARSITLSDADVGSANASVNRASAVGENGAVDGSTGGGENGSDSEEEEEDEDGEDYWHTSVGKFKFSLDQLPQTLQYIHQLLTEIPTIKKPDILYYVLQCLNVMALHGDALAKAAREHRGFFIWCQENLLIKNLWDLCNAEHSHICQVCVPLLLHCITLPLGSDVFWRVVQEAFHDTDWRVRFTAVERVTVITRFMDSTPLRSEVGLQTAMATAFCHLIACMDDINVYTAQRATLYIGTIHDTAIWSLLFCLESQFDLFIVDRPVVLQSLYQLHNSLSDRKILSWEFFLNRFDTLFVEAQINLEKCGDISYLRDLRNSENGSEALSSKILKAREALSQSDTTGSMAKTLSASFGTKWPYKRTMSAPASMVPRQDSKFVPEKEKIYSRQISAPILKRKTSRFGLGQFLGSSGSHNANSTTIHSLPTVSNTLQSTRPTGHPTHSHSLQIHAQPSNNLATLSLPSCPIHNPQTVTINVSVPSTTSLLSSNVNTITTSFVAPTPTPTPTPTTLPIATTTASSYSFFSFHFSSHSSSSSNSSAPTVVATTSNLASAHSQSHQYLLHCGAPPSQTLGHSPMPTLQETENFINNQTKTTPTKPCGSSSSNITNEKFNKIVTPTQSSSATHSHHSLHSHFQKHPSAPNLLPPPPPAVPCPTPTASTSLPPMSCTCDVGCGSSIQMPSAAPATQDGHIHSLGGINDENLIGLLSRITELEESDRETIHLLVFLLMQFMSRTDQAFPMEDKPLSKAQNIVLKHLFLLLGHNQIDKTFHITPDALRCSAVFNAFMASLPQVMDQNHLIGGLILPSVMQIILYVPNPNNSSPDSYQNIVFNYTLWYLEQFTRRSWLFTLLVVLYKYSYTQPPQSGYVLSGIRIVMNSLRAHFHQCRRIPTTTILDIQGNSRSRDVSQPSLGTDPDDKEQSPPASPMFPSEGTSGASKGKGQNVAFTPKLQHAFRKYTDSSLDNDETESELVAIPESDLSDSTLHGSSAPGSFDDAIHFEDINSTKLEVTRGRSTRTTDVSEEKTTKTHKSMITTKTGDTYTTKIKSASETVSTTVITTHTKHSLQEGVRMFVTPIVGPDPRETVTISPPVDVHQALTIRNRSVENGASSTSKMFAAIATNHLKALGALQDIHSRPLENSNRFNNNRLTNVTIESSDKLSNLLRQKSASSTQPHESSLKKPIGRTKTIVDCSAGNSSSNGPEDNRLAVNLKKSQSKGLKRSDKAYGSPDSPLSRMSIMPNPIDETESSAMPTPKNIAALEIPTPERLLPIGPHESVAAIVERVREGLNLPDISHLKQESLDVSESTKDDVTPNSRTTSPRRLIKQVALESPPNAASGLAKNAQSEKVHVDLHTSILKSVQQSGKVSGSQTQPQPSTSQQHKVDSGKRPRQKLAPFTVDMNAIPDIRSRYAGCWPPPPYEPATHRDEDEGQEGRENGNGHNGNNLDPNRASTRRVGDYTVCERCTECGALMEEYTDEEIGILIVILATFIHREPSMAAPFLPEILTIAGRISMAPTHAWQGENGPPLHSSAQAVSLQFLRCVLHQLAPNGIFLQLFQTQLKNKVRQSTFRSMAKALIDFQELNATSPVYMVCESLQSKKSLPIEQLPTIFRNIAEYLQSIPPEAGTGPAVWSQAMQAMETLLRQVIVIMSNISNPEYMLDLMVATLKINSVPKTLLDPYSKMFAYCVQHTHLEFNVLYELCTLNARSFSKDRDKMYLCRQMIFEFTQALKFKTNIPDHNLLMIIGFVLLDAGGNLPAGTIQGLPDTTPVLTTNAAECMRQYINDVIDFLADFHTLSKIKNFKNGQTQNGLGEDTLGGVLKGAVAQYLALEMSRGNSRDNKAVARYLPWLYNAPSSLQQGPKEFTECVGHMRLLSWLLLGSLTHMALVQQRSYNNPNSVQPNTQQQQQQQQGNPTPVIPTSSVHYHHQGVTYSHPVPQEASCHIADHIQVIFAGFAEQSKTSVLHMSSLFHAFTLCQLWTVYLEQMAHNSNNPEGNTMGVLFEFWAKVTPCILQLVSHSKSPKEPADFAQNSNAKLSEMVNLHFLSLLEALKETNSTVLSKLLPMWSPVLSSQTQLSDTLHVRLQNVRDYEPKYDEQHIHPSEALLKWLQRLQFKMGQIEVQASTATQFYSI